MNRFGYLPETNSAQNNFNENMYANQFGYNPYVESDSDDEDLDFGNAFGRLNLYNRFGYNSDEDSDSDEENSFGYASDSTDSSADSEFGSTNFGKKLRKVHSDAKKAMRMAHSEGISLKEAWKKVKKGGKTTSKRKKTTKKTTKKSSRSEAKRAMKLKHSRGISLKAAWKIVKKERR